MSGIRRKPGRLGSFVDGYRVWLLERGYTPGTVRGMLKLLGHLGRWMERERREPGEIDLAAVEEFLASLRADGLRRVPTLRALRSMVLYLREVGVIAADAGAQELTPVEGLVGAYRDWLVTERGLAAATVLRYENLARRFLTERVSPADELDNSIRSRNLRLTAIRSLFKYAALRHPEHAAAIGHVLAIPPKRHHKRTVTYLTADEATALIDAPDQTRWEGRRDRAMFTVAIHAGLRVSELIGLNCGDVVLGTGAHVRCHGKGRKQRTVPLTADAQAVLATWLAERAGRPHDPLFPTRTGRRLSRDAIEQRVRTHAAAAATRCASLAAKQLHPHVLRHSCAMSLLQAGVDTTVIALWLGHADIRSTQPYLHADLTIKERALALVTPATAKPSRYKPPDTLLAFLEGL